VVAQRGKQILNERLVMALACGATAEAAPRGAAV
jgi:hypothetical protein